jgi:hypothetical protein
MQIDFQRIGRFPWKSEKLNSRKFKTGVTKKASWFRVAAFLAGPWVTGVTVEAREKRI